MFVVFSVCGFALDNEWCF